MDNDTLNIKVVEPLLKTTNSIARLFQDLCDYEKIGKKDSIEYRKKLNYLFMVKEFEDEIYANLSRNVDICKEAAFHIIGEKLPDKIYSDIDSIILHEHEYKVIRRIVITLNQIITASPLSFQNVPFLDVENNKKMKESYLNFNYLLGALQKDFINTFLFHLNEAIAQETEIEKRNRLIDAKYYALFIFPYASIELAFSDNNRKIPQLTSFFLEYCNDTEDVYSKIHNSFLVRNAKEQLSRIVVIDKYDQNFDFTICEMIIKSFIELMSINEIDELYDFYTYCVYSNNVDSELEKSLDNIFMSAIENKDRIISLKM